MRVNYTTVVNMCLYVVVYIHHSLSCNRNSTANKCTPKSEIYYSKVSLRVHAHHAYIDTCMS